MWNPFKRRVDWEREYDALYRYALRQENNLRISMELNQKLVELLEKKNGNHTIYEFIQKE